VSDDDQPPVIVIAVRGLDAADLGCVDALARLQLAARRNGGSIRFLAVPDELRELLCWIGLDDVLLSDCDGRDEVARQLEQREQGRRIEERLDRPDPAC
jgi:anti-anti-sigma regulatory factor